MAKLRKKITSGAGNIKKGAKLLGKAGKAFGRNLVGGDSKMIYGKGKKK